MEGGGGRGRQPTLLLFRHQMTADTDLLEPIGAAVGDVDSGEYKGQPTPIRYVVQLRHELEAPKAVLKPKTEGRFLLAHIVRLIWLEFAMKVCEVDLGLQFVRSIVQQCSPLHPTSPFFLAPVHLHSSLYFASP